MPAKRKTVFGIAMRNFTRYPEMPSARGLIEYGVRMEELGFESLWAWDHILLGVEPSFPIHEALTILTAVAARTSKIKVGTGILVMPMRNPVQKPRPPILIGGYVDAVLKRAATKGDGWLTYYYTAESFAKTWARVRGFAEEAGRNPEELISTNQLPICVGPRAKIEAPMKEWLQTEWDYASWSESTMDSAIMGTPEECVAQLEPHLATGIDRIIFVPYKYEKEQIDALARDIIPRLQKKMG